MPAPLTGGGHRRVRGRSVWFVLADSQAMDEIELEDAADTAALQRLVAAYADTVSRRAWGELADQFTADAVVYLDLLDRGTLTLIGPGEIGAFIDRAIAQFEFFQFVPLNLHLMLRHGGSRHQAHGRLWMSELRQAAGGGAWTTIYGLYRDEYVRGADGRWRIAGRRYQSLARTNPPMQVFPIPTDG